MTKKTTSDEKVKPWQKKDRKHVLLALAAYSHTEHQGLVRYARNSDWTIEVRREGFDTMRRRQSAYDGVIASGPFDKSFSSFIDSFDVPVVGMDTWQVKDHITSVLRDEEAIGRMAADHFIERGFKNCTYISPMGPAGTIRYKGFKERLAQASVNVLDFKWPRAMKAPSTERWYWLQKTLAEMPKPLALMIAGPGIVLDVVSSCQEANLRIPEEIAVIVGYDMGWMDAELATIPLTCVRLDDSRKGYEAAALLDRLMNGDPAPNEPVIIPPTRIVTRKSTNIQAVEHPSVAIALSFIRENAFNKMLGVDDVVEQVTISKRALYKAFTKHLGKTPLELIIELRIEKAKALLREDLKIKFIADRCGFSSNNHMYRIFRDHVGMTPGKFREDSLA